MSKLVENLKELQELQELIENIKIRGQSHAQTSTVELSDNTPNAISDSGGNKEGNLESDEKEMEFLLHQLMKHIETIHISPDVKKEVESLLHQLMQYISRGVKKKRTGKKKTNENEKS